MPETIRLAIFVNCPHCLDLVKPYIVSFHAGDPPHVTVRCPVCDRQFDYEKEPDE